MSADTPLLGPLIVAGYTAACMAMGVATLRLLSGRRDPTHISVAARLTTAFILGQAVLSQALLLIGLVASLAAGVVVACLAAAVVLGGRHTVYWIREGRGHGAALHAWFRKAPRLQQASALLLALYTVLLALAAFFYPPVGDAEALYLAYPKFIAALGEVAPFRGLYEPISSIGLQGEMNFAALMVIAGPRSAKLFGWVVGLAAVFMLDSVGRSAGLGKWGRIALAVMAVTSTTFSYYMFDGKVDLFAAALGLSAIFWAVAPGPPGLVHARIAGVCAGLACVAKLSYVPTLIPAVLLLLAWRARDKGLRGASGEWLTFAVLAAVAVVPHVIKNAVFFGEPLAPFVTSMPHGAWLESNRVWFDADATQWILSTYPLALVFGQYPMQGGNLSFLWLAFLPWLVFLRRARPWHESRLVMVALAGALGLAIWLVFRPSVLAPRYYLASLLLLLLPAAAAIEHVSAMKPRVLRWGAAACVFVALAVSIKPLAEPREFASYVLGRVPACYRSSVCESVRPLNESAAPDERVYFSSYHSYWLRPDLMLYRDTYAENGAVFSPDSTHAPWEALVAMGFTYVVIDTTVWRDRAQLLQTSLPPVTHRVNTLATTPPLLIFKLTPLTATDSP